MKYEDKLPDFIDGLLSEEEERDIYIQLGEDEDLRHDYKSINTIINSINNNINLFAPSQSATEGVFSVLGFSLPAQEDKEENKKIFKLHRIAYTISSIAAGFLLFFIFSQEIKIGNNQSFSSYYSKALSTENTAPYSQKADLKSTYSKEKHAQKSSIINAFNNSEDNFSDTQSQIYTDNDLQMQNTTQINNDFKQEVQLESNKQIHQVKPNIDLSNSLVFSNKYPNNDIPRNDIELPVSKYSSENFTVEVKNSYYFNPEDGGKNSGRLNNLGLTILYQLDDNFSAGIDFRDEPFEVASNRVDYYRNILSSNDATYKGIAQDTKHNVDYTTIGVAVRYSTNRKEMIYPIGQLVLGKNKDGLVGRVNFGLCFKPLPGFTTTAGIELSNMNYQNSGSTHNATKLGINYGIAYSF